MVPSSAPATTDFAHVELSFGGFDALRAVHFARRFPPHFHDTFAIGVVEAGSCLIRTRRGEWTARPGSILAFSPGEMHAAIPCTTDGYTYRMLYPPSELMLEIGAAAPVFTAPVIDDPALARCLTAAHEPLVARRADSASETRLIDALRMLASRHILGANRQDGPASDEQVVAIAHEFFAARLSRQVRLQEVAAACGVSQFLLIRIFRRTVGVTPIAYLIQLRVLRAQAMLGSGAAVVDAAYACGFSDQSHLTRTFRDVVGIPPGRYLRSVRPAVA